MIRSTAEHVEGYTSTLALNEGRHQGKTDAISNWASARNAYTRVSIARWISCYAASLTWVSLLAREARPSQIAEFVAIMRSHSYAARNRDLRTRREQGARYHEGKVIKEDGTGMPKFQVGDTNKQDEQHGSSAQPKD